MFLIPIVKVVLIFPFVFYFLINIIFGKKRATQIFFGLVYAISLLFISKYIFGLVTGISLSLVILLVCFIISKLKMNKRKNKRYRKFIYVVREELTILSILYPYIYIVLLIVGIIKEF